MINYNIRLMRAIAIEGNGVRTIGIFNIYSKVIQARDLRRGIAFAIGENDDQELALCRRRAVVLFA